MPVFNKDKLADYCAGVKRTTGFDSELRWESGRIHSLPQDYADMLGWDGIAQGAAKAYSMVSDKTSCMFYAENYGMAGAVMVLGKKYKLPEPACFSESFFYWLPHHLPTEIKTLIYINYELGGDVKNLYADCQLIGQVNDTLSRGFGTEVWLCTNPRSSFNKFWEERILMITNPFR